MLSRSRTSSSGTVAQPGRPEFQPGRILECLRRHGVDFVLIGGLAGMALGSSLPSFDVDVAYERGKDNLERLAAALQELKATLRGAPPGLPFLLDAKTLENGAMFTFETPFGSLDILSDPSGSPPYQQLRAAGQDVAIDGVPTRVASIDHLIAMKESTGREKDRYMAQEYRVLSDELRAPRD
jgi:hypothetical protein